MEANMMPAREAGARAVRPVAHWVLMPDGSGGRSLQMVWAAVNPILAPAQRTSSAAALHST